MLHRELSLLQATAINMIDMVGIGPFITTSIVALAMGSVHLAILAWLIGMIIALIDASVWSELGAKFPRAGGTYQFLREAYGPTTWGRFFSFLFVWQTLFQAPLVVTSGALGFAKYAGFFFMGKPTTVDVTARLIAVGVVAVLTILLYRKISDVGRLSVVLWTTVVCTIVGIIVIGFFKGAPYQVFSELVQSPSVWFSELSNATTWTALGVASLPTMYSYLGYYNICHLGSEVRTPEKIIPRSMYTSILGIGLLYLCVQIAVYSVLPWSAVSTSKFVISDMLVTAVNPTVAGVGTALILVIAAASLFSVMLGYTRIPYAAAQEGQFFRVFGRLHPTLNFPHVSLLALAGMSVVFVLILDLTDAIKSIITMRVFTQFIAQSCGLVLLRRRIGSGAMPWKMWLYPVPVVLTVVLWAWIYTGATPTQKIVGIAAPLLGAIVFLGLARYKNEWPWREES